MRRTIYVETTIPSFYFEVRTAPEMVARRSGAIACITSPASYLAWPNACAYIAARHALRGFAEALRSEVKGKGLKVTLVVLGTVETPYWQHNPGSRKHVPATNETLMPTLSAEEAAATILNGIAAGKTTVVKPGLYRALYLLNALAPGLVAKQLRRAARKA